MFVGGFAHSPNAEAVYWFLSSVWPRVQAARPESEFVIVGSSISESMARDWTQRGAVVAGRVEDLAPLYRGTRVAVAPLLTGAGFKGKVAEAISFGVPCVGTSVAFEGMGLRSGVEVLCAEEADDFASQVISLLCDNKLWLMTSNAATQFAIEHWSHQTTGPILQKLLVGPTRSQPLQSV
jgi:glycosyltransferase involved in cell wall biosynthesis